MGGWLFLSFCLLVFFGIFVAWVMKVTDPSVPLPTPEAESTPPSVTPPPSRSPPFRVQRNRAAAVSRSTHASRPTDYEALSSLPTIYYGLAILCGVVLIGFTIANSDELSSTEIGAWIGYTVGAVLSMFAVGRVIELLEQIRNAVRNIPALSPGKPDDK